MTHKLLAKLRKKGHDNHTALSIFDHLLARHAEFDDARVWDFPINSDEREDVYMLCIGTHKEWNGVDSVSRSVVFVGVHPARAMIRVAYYNLNPPYDLFWTLQGVHDYRERVLRSRLNHSAVRDRSERCEPFNSFPYSENPWDSTGADLAKPDCFEFIENKLNEQKFHPALGVVRTMLAIQNCPLEICDRGYCCEDLRDHECLPPDQRQITACQKWLAKVPKIMKGPTKSHTSFFWSQIVSHDLGMPISEGAFIEACEGLYKIKTERCHATSTSAFVNISLSAHKLYPYYGKGVVDFPPSPRTILTPDLYKSLC